MKKKVGYINDDQFDPNGVITVSGFHCISVVCRFVDFILITKFHVFLV